MEDFMPPKVCQFCGGEIPSKKNSEPAAPCTCNSGTDKAGIY